MNPEAVEWLETLEDAQRMDEFTPVYPWDGNLFSLKPDHEVCFMCKVSDLVVIE